MKKSIFLLLIVFCGDSCVERIDFSSGNSNSQLVIEGQISDEAGPYTVKLSRTKKISDFTQTIMVSASKVVISDNSGTSETLTEVSAGIFQTKSNGIRGVIGREYTLRVETKDGNIYESSPEKISSPGSVEKIYYTFEKYFPTTGPPKYQFRIFMDSKGEEKGDNLYRWKFTGTYRAQTNPELHTKLVGQDRVQDPYPCSGYGIKADILTQLKPCECCTCWAKLTNPKPIVSDIALVSGNQFINIEVGIVPVEYWVFYDKVQIDVQQISLTQAAFNYYKIIGDQKEGSSSLFQPAIGKAHTNMMLKSGTQEAQGLFSAFATSKKTIYIGVDNIPLGPEVIPAAPPPIPEPCATIFPFATYIKPNNW
jgi:hypothetical protein